MAGRWGLDYNRVVILASSRASRKKSWKILEGPGYHRHQIDFVDNQEMVKAMAYMVKFGIGICILALLGCGSAKTQDNGDQGQVPEPKNPSKQLNRHGLYGVWEGRGANEDGFSPFKMTFTFKPGRITLTKECFYGARNVAIEASAATNDNSGGLHVALAGVLSAFLTIDGASCSIDFPYGLEFFVRDEKVVVRLQGNEKITGLKKIAEL